MKKIITLAALLASVSAAEARTFTVNTPLDVVDANPGNCVCANAGLCSLRAAVQEANACAGADVIQIGVASLSLTIAGQGEDLAATGDLDVTQTVTIEGGGATLDLGFLDRGFDVRPPAAVTLTLRDLTIKNGDPGPAPGGALRVLSQAVLERVDLTGNSAIGGGAVDVKSGGSLSISGEGSHGLFGNQDTNAGCAGGGAILNEGGTVLLYSVHLETNMSLCSGGAVRSNAGTVEAHSGMYASNSGGNGGVFSIGAGSLLVDGGEFYDNRADFDGGALAMGGGTVTVSGAFIQGNQSGLKGGAMAVSGGTLTLGGGGVTGNAASDGGALSVAFPGTAAVSDCSIDNNVASGRGGDLYATGTVTFDRTVLELSSAGLYGGSIALAGAKGQVTLREDSAISRAHAPAGGAISVEAGFVSVLETTLIDNYSTGSQGGGAAIVLNTGELGVTQSGVIGNDAQAGPGGGIATRDSGRAYASQSTFSGNHAAGNGGAIHAAGSYKVSMGGVTIAENSSDARGGGLAASASSGFSASNTILARNTAPSFPATRTCQGSLTSTGSNLLELVGSCGYVSAAGDLLGVSSGLLALTTINGRSVHPIDPTSAARDTGNDLFCGQSDQLETPRPQGAHCDIGAYELP